MASLTKCKTSSLHTSARLCSERSSAFKMWCADLCVFEAWTKCPNAIATSRRTHQCSSLAILRNTSRRSLGRRYFAPYLTTKSTSAHLTASSRSSLNNIKKACLGNRAPLIESDVVMIRLHIVSMMVMYASSTAYSSVRLVMYSRTGAKRAVVGFKSRLATRSRSMRSCDCASTLTGKIAASSGRTVSSV